MTQVISPFSSKMGRMARVLPISRTSRDLSSEQKRLARHIAREPGMTIKILAERIGWDASVSSLGLKLKAINIRCSKSLNTADSAFGPRS